MNLVFQSNRILLCKGQVEMLAVMVFGVTLAPFRHVKTVDIVADDVDDDDVHANKCVYVCFGILLKYFSIPLLRMNLKQ